MLTTSLSLLRSQSNSHPSRSSRYHHVTMLARTPNARLITICAAITSLIFVFGLHSYFERNVSLTSDMVTGSQYSQYQTQKPRQRNSDLIVYAYHETETARPNLEFFLRHGLHDKADFVFLMNGDYRVKIPKRPNIRVIDRDNTCFDLGSYEELFVKQPSTFETGSEIRMYKRYLLINASVRGPFFPSWALDRCWSDMYFNKLSDKIRAVGMSYNCAPAKFLQSMVLAADRYGLEIIVSAMGCFDSKNDAVLQGEEHISKNMRNAGYDIYSMNAAFQARNGGNGSLGYDRWCVGGDHVCSNCAEGISPHPYETL